MLHDGTDTTARCLFLITFSLNDCFQSEYFQCSGGSGTSDSIDNFLGADSYPAITDKWQQLLRLNLTELPPSTGPLSTLDWWRRGGVWSYGWCPLVSSGVFTSPGDTDYTDWSLVRLWWALVPQPPAHIAWRCDRRWRWDQYFRFGLKCLLTKTWGLV